MSEESDYLDMLLSGEEPSAQRILAIDTSSTFGSVALVEGGTVIAEQKISRDSTHSERLMPAIEALLKDCNLGVSEIDLFAVGSGPGSFTGLRVGVSTLKGLAWAVSRPVIGVSTLQALAMNIKEQDALICPVLDARKGQVYSALFMLSCGELERVMEDGAQCPEEVLEVLTDTGLVNESMPLIFVGHGLSVYGDMIKSKIGESIFAPEELWNVSAGNIGLIASSKPDEVVTPVELLPTYRRASEAEFKRN